MVTQYLRAAKLIPNPHLATALFYGIKSDTRDLGREYEPADIDCYNWLFPLIDKPALSRIEHPSVPARYFAAYHLAGCTSCGASSEETLGQVAVGYQLSLEKLLSDLNGLLS